MAKAEPNPTTRGAARSGNREAVVGNVRLRQVLREAAAARAAHPRASAGSPQSALRPGSVSVGGEQRLQLGRNFCEQRHVHLCRKRPVDAPYVRRVKR